MTIENTPALKLLENLAMHIEYDSGLNGSKFTDSPYGRVTLKSDGWWKKEVAACSNENGDAAQLVKDIDVYLKQNVSLNDAVATLPMDEKEESLWQRIQSNFSRPPDIITDVVAPLIKQEMEMN